MELQVERKIKRLVDIRKKKFCLKEVIKKVDGIVEKVLISRVLRETNWHRRKAAELLEISYRSLLYKIKEYKLRPEH